MKRRRKVSAKALAEALAAAERFQNMQMMALAPWKALEIRARPGFIPVSQYPRWQVPQVNEIGRDAKYRYVAGS